LAIGFGSGCTPGSTGPTGTGGAFAPDETGNNWYCNGNTDTVTYPAYWFGSTATGCGSSTAGLMQWTGSAVTPNNTLEFCNGASRTAVNGAAASVPLSGILAATTTSAINNGNYWQTWAWNSLAGNTALALTTTDLTTGTILEVENTSGGNHTNATRTLSRPAGVKWSDHH
jgi:hypothetical protein